jgi:hypothetical protein
MLCLHRLSMRFEVYTRKGGMLDGSPKGVVSRLLYGAGATGSTGRILRTDNFYTSLVVMRGLPITSTT